MIPFKDIELQDKELITSFTLNSPRRNCDLSFSNLCSWRFLYNTKFAIMDGFLLLKFWADGELVYMMPIGNGDLNKVLDALIEDANREGEPFCLLGICSGMCSELETFMPGRFQFTADRDYADYVYLRSDLATFLASPQFDLCGALIQGHAQTVEHLAALLLRGRVTTQNSATFYVKVACFLHANHRFILCLTQACRASRDETRR